MLLLKFLCIVFLILLTNHQDQVEATFSSARTRSQSLKTLRRNYENKPGSQRTSSSSSDSLPQIDAKTEPKPSTSKQACEGCLHEVNLQPIAEEKAIRKMRTEINLNEAMVSTHSDGHINPLRDGVYARIRNIFHQHSIPLAFGTVVGLGGFEIGRNFYNQTFATEVSHTSTQAPAKTTRTTAITTTESSKNSKNNDEEIIDQV